MKLNKSQMQWKKNFFICVSVCVGVLESVLERKIISHYFGENIAPR